MFKSSKRKYGVRNSILEPNARKLDFLECMDFTHARASKIRANHKNRLPGVKCGQKECTVGGRIKKSYDSIARCSDHIIYELLEWFWVSH